MPENSGKGHHLKISETCRITRRTPYFSAFTGNDFLGSFAIISFPSQFVHGLVSRAASGGIALWAYRRLGDGPTEIANFPHARNSISRPSAAKYDISSVFLSDRR
jgi:hypothetical protein